MIIEGLITTINSDGTTNVAPMGPFVESEFRQFELRPFQSATTFTNLVRTREAVFHVTDDAAMIARAAIHQLEDHLQFTAAGSIKGSIIPDCCRWYELQVMQIDDSSTRASIHCSVRASGRNRDFAGFNRAKHSILELAIMVTRIDFLPIDQIKRALEDARTVIEKTGEPTEIRAWHQLDEYVCQAQLPFSETTAGNDETTGEAGTRPTNSER